MAPAAPAATHHTVTQTIIYRRLSKVAVHTLRVSQYYKAAFVAHQLISGLSQLEDDKIMSLA